RRRAGSGFTYVDESGKRVTDGEVLARIRAVAIPPAWTDVWICRSARGHIQATGRDARGRRQYRYHALWQQTRDATKYERTIAFAKALPRLRRQVERDLRRRGLPREKVLAAIVRLLEMTLIRVGNEEYARDNRSFGLTTLRNRHARVTSSGLKLSFRGKGGKEHVVGLQDRRLARVMKSIQELPGQLLFQYEDDEGKPQAVDSDDVNEYLRSAMGDDFSAKDFRTWAGTVLAASALQELDIGDPAKPTNAALGRAVAKVAAQLGNTPTVCRRCYIHPQIVDAYLDGSLAGEPKTRLVPLRPRSTSLRPEERRVLQLLERRLARENRSRSRRRAASEPAA
ncbi:MAG TPA: hypothetical protein VEX62_12600, partial [Candidatus Limnocylindrales bacterium]|nr:hypothetical protein [Candidatus Limnocylindrales bacterium]